MTPWTNHRPSQKLASRVSRTLLLAAFLIGLFADPLLKADPPVTNDSAQDQLVSQAKNFHETETAPPEKIPEKTEIESKEEKAPELPETGPSFMVQKIILEGNTVFTEGQLRPFVSAYENKTLTFGKLQKLANSITELYIQKGYTTSRAYLPPQKIFRDSVLIKIIEGKMAELTVEGNKYFSSKVYREILHLKKSNLFRYQDLERGLLTLNQKPDRSGKAYITAGQEIGTSDIILKAKDSFPIHAAYEFNNFGTKLTHLARNILRLTDNNLLGFGDTLNASMAFAEQSAIQSMALNYSFPIETTGTTFRLGTSYTRSQLVGYLRTFEVQGRYLGVTPEISQALIRRSNFTLDGSLGLEYKDSETTLGGRRVNVDRTRVLKPELQTSYTDHWGGRTALSFAPHIGIPHLFGGLKEKDSKASRPNTGGEFIYYTLNIARAQRLPFSSFLMLRGTWQKSHRLLTSVEQFRAGGSSSVRGYPEADSQGDNGYNFSTELNVPVPFLPKTWIIPKTNQPWRQTLRLVTFLDLAKASQYARLNPSDVLDRFLLGTGAGVRFNLLSNIAFRLDWGFPLGDKSNDKDRSQLHLSCQVGL